MRSHDARRWNCTDATTPCDSQLSRFGNSACKPWSAMELKLSCQSCPNDHLSSPHRWFAADQSKPKSGQDASSPVFSGMFAWAQSRDSITMDLRQNRRTYNFHNVRSTNALFDQRDTAMRLALVTRRRPGQDRQKPSSAKPTQLNTNTHEAITVSDAKVTMVWTDGIIELRCRQHSYFWRSTFVQTRRKLLSIDIESECGCIATAWKHRPQKPTFASPSDPRRGSSVWPVCRLMTPRRVWSERLCRVCLRWSR
jgi:hypothetical protein